MKSHAEHLTFSTSSRREYININSNVEKALAQSGIKEGMVLVSATK